MLADFHSGMNDAVGHSTPEQLLKDALAAQRRGSIADAKRLYGLVLSIDRTNAAARGNLAIIAAQQGDLAGAERLFRQTIKLSPNDPAGYNNLGSVLQQQTRLADAIAAHRHAIKLRPNYAEAYLALGNALRQQGKLEDAMQSYRSAIAARRDYPEAHNNLGVLLQMQGRLDDATTAYRQAITQSLEEYEQTALALARDPQRLIALRRKLQNNRDASALFDLPRLTRNIEAAYERMWQTCLSGQRPAAFSIENA